MISSSLEEYLRNMYILNKTQGSIRVTDVANVMNCTKPSVNKAIKSNLYKMMNNKLIFSLYFALFILSISVFTKEDEFTYEPVKTFDEKVAIQDEGKVFFNDYLNARKIIESYDIVFVFLKDVLGLDEALAKSEAEKLKSDMSDVTINKLVKYVHKELGLTDLSCNYDVNQQRCRECLRVSIRDRKGDK